MNIDIKILQYSYWEHFRANKDLALILPIGHPKRIELEKTKEEINPLLILVVNFGKSNYIISL